MSSLQEIELAISSLSPEDQVKLVLDLPALLPSQASDLAWRRILSDPTPSPALSRLADAVDDEYRRDPESFLEIKGTDFDRNS